MHWEEAGKRYNEAERWAKAELSLAHALENGSTNTEILRALALAQLKTGHFLQAKITIQQLLKENPMDSVALDFEAMVPKE
jgi:Flp pilus assembly protein TadD